MIEAITRAIDWLLPVPIMTMLSALSAIVLLYKIRGKGSWLLISPLVGRMYLAFIYGGVIGSKALTLEQNDLLLRLGMAVMLTSDLISFFFWKLPNMVIWISKMAKIVRVRFGHNHA